MGLLAFTKKGIYCERARVYIDPWKPVDYAIITHAHADHSRAGNKHYLCHHDSKAMIKHRLGEEISIESKAYEETFQINGVQFSFHPAGHIIGSAQVRVEYKGEFWVVSGDYKLEDDGISEPFVPVKCHVFITECTFGLPVFQWKEQKAVYGEINNWWAKNKAAGKLSLLSAYSLGKAQRLLQNINPEIGPIYAHGAIENSNRVLRSIGKDIQATLSIEDHLTKDDLKGALVLAPPGAIGSNWTRRFPAMELGIASGWMALRGARRRMSADRGFVLSDHCDWEGLNKAVVATGCEKVITTHGYTDVFSRWLNEKGIESVVESTEFEGESLSATD